MDRMMMHRGLVVLHMMAPGYGKLKGPAGRGRVCGSWNGSGEEGEWRGAAKEKTLHWMPLP